MIFTFASNIITWLTGSGSRLGFSKFHFLTTPSINNCVHSKFSISYDKSIVNGSGNAEEGSVLCFKCYFAVRNIWKTRCRLFRDLCTSEIRLNCHWELCANFFYHKIILIRIKYALNNCLMQPIILIFVLQRCVSRIVISFYEY